MNQTNYPITEELVHKINYLVSCGLTKGLGQSKEGSMCIEAVICHAYGLPHSDNPPCVGEKIRTRRKAWTRVRNGDSLYTIAQRAGMSVSKLARLNGLRLSSTIRAGRRLRIH